ncbi:MAG: hypothetical protein HZB38_15890, partial [Planctomycetes bacterium]|nr:hypothetical protein [Planctomycetota bacterium]
ALVQAAELWNTKYRHELEDPAERTQLVSGNQLAVASWMLHDLGLLSESCRLIEPRSKILRQTDIGRQKWVRVDLDAWIPYLSGDLTAAIESSYEAALDVLRQPPQPGESDAIIRNPLVAARIAYFLYQSPEDRRVEDVLSAVGQPSHPALVEYVRWMLAALGENNETLIRRHLLSVLPKLTDEAVEPLAHQAALLEYVRERPDADVLSTARQRIFQSPAGPSRDLWLAVADALVALNAGKPAEAAETLKNLGDRPEVAALRSTTEFLTNPPASAASFPALEKVRLAVPVGRDGGVWIVLDGQRQLRLFDSKLARLTPIAKPDPSWFPSPLTWPWLSREPASGRVWTYSRRRVLELTPNAPKPFRCSISSPEIAAFDRDLSGQFTTLAEAVDASPRPAGENSEFLRSEIQSHAESMADPDLPELGFIAPLPQDPRIVQVAMRGGPHLLINARTGKAWTSRWLTEKLGLTQPLTFVAQALWEKPQSAGETPPIVLLLSNQGLIRFDTGSERVEQIPLPISPPFPALIPENAPYPRRDPDFAYFALPPEAGGRAFRLEVASGVVAAVDMINESLPDRYYDAMSRAEIRAEIDRRFRDRQLGSLEEFVADAVRVVAKWRSTPE